MRLKSNPVTMAFDVYKKKAVLDLHCHVEIRWDKPSEPITSTTQSTFDLIDESDTPANSKLIESGHTPVTFRARFRDTLPRGAEEQLFINLIAIVPREHLGYLAWVSPVGPRVPLLTVPNLERVYLMPSAVSDMFLQPDPLSRTKIFHPSDTYLWCISTYKTTTGAPC